MNKDYSLQTDDMTMRSDHLIAVIKYALEQTISSNADVNPLDFDDNENTVGDDSFGSTSQQRVLEIGGAIHSLLQAALTAKGKHHKDLVVVDREHYHYLLSLDKS